MYFICINIYIQAYLHIHLFTPLLCAQTYMNILSYMCMHPYTYETKHRLTVHSEYNYCLFIDKHPNICKKQEKGLHLCMHTIANHSIMQVKNTGFIIPLKIKHRALIKTISPTSCTWGGISLSLEDQFPGKSVQNCSLINYRTDKTLRKKNSPMGTEKKGIIKQVLQVSSTSALHLPPSKMSYTIIWKPHHWLQCRSLGRNMLLSIISGIENSTFLATYCYRHRQTWTYLFATSLPSRKQSFGFLCYFL